MQKELISMTVSDSVIRLVVTDGKQVTDWTELRLQPGQVESSVVNDPSEVAARIRQALEIKEITARKVLVGIGGIRCFTRPLSLPKLPKELLDEAVRREAARVLPVPLNDLYMSWQTIPAPEDKTLVFITAIPRAIVDSLVEMLDNADLKPVFLDLKPLLLARVATEKTTILVDVQENDFDIVVMVKGVPQPIRTVTFPGEDLNIEDRIFFIQEELERTITFYNSSNPEIAISDDMPVHVSGDLDDIHVFTEMMAERIDRKIDILSSPVDVPEDFDTSAHISNIGLILQESTPANIESPSVVNLNALPVEYRPQSVSSVNILKLLGIALPIILAIAMAVMIQGTSSSIAAKQASLDSSRVQLAQRMAKVQTLNQDIENLNEEIQDAKSLAQRLTAALAILELQSISSTSDMKVTLGSTPSVIRVDNIIHENHTLTISGTSPNEQKVNTYISTLAATGRFTDIEMTSLTLIEGQDSDDPEESYTFTLLGRLLVDTNWVSAMEVILGNCPPSITLRFATTADGALTLTGNSPTEELLLEYLEQLDESGKFTEITIVDIVRLSEDDTLNFIVILRIGVTTDENTGDD